MLLVNSRQCFTKRFVLLSAGNKLECQIPVYKRLTGLGQQPSLQVFNHAFTLQPYMIDPNPMPSFIPATVFLPCPK